MKTAVTTNLTPLRGWAPRGERLTVDAPFGSWGTQALIAPWVVKDAMDGPAFAAYVQKVLIPEIAPGTEVVLDNLATHRNKEAAAALKAHGCWFLYLPPYSPDLNPVGLAFSTLKAQLRRISARSFTSVFEALGNICEIYSPQGCSNDFQAAD
ncbi:transposase [Pseudorhodobacter turbinis]|uniref:Transposase n=1 Tax=Pseudorhodobacter turbinis TaxID=2500533 RepID=A0A4P8EFM0_9RHOB|nr:transposase [Pseudorhodobacter turbinis]QCO55900.1 transposase [Pseudorhodobacter turbinis]